MHILSLSTLVLASTLSVMAQQDRPPDLLSEAGIFVDMCSQVLADDLVPYSVNSPLWSDGTVKTRFIRLPAGTEVEFLERDHWVFPGGTLLVKNFYLDLVVGDPTTRHIVETRFLVKRQTDETWDGYSYQWNEAGTDAVLLADSSSVMYVIEDPQDEVGFFLQTYYFPSADNCRSCHTRGAGFVLGLHTDQMNRIEAGGQNQLARFAPLFAGDTDLDYSSMPRLPDPADLEESVRDRARSYLHANCAQCHRPGSIGRTSIDLRYDTPLAQTQTVDVFPTLGDMGASNPRIVAPGDPDNSTLYLRMLTLGTFRMPALATSIVDVQGAGLVRRWILGLAPPTVVADNLTEPTSSTLEPNFPNPFNSSTNLSYHLQQSGTVHLAIYSSVGRLVRTLVEDRMPAGWHHVQWDGLDAQGLPAASGLYISRLETESLRQVRKMVMIK